MTFHFKKNFSLLPLGATLSALALISGCGGGGSGGGSSTPTATPAPSPFNGTYNATYVPSTAVPADGQAPSGSLTVSGGKASSQTTFYIQPTVVTGVQKAINDGLNAKGYGYAIPDNQFPSNIAFTASGSLDGSGKVVLTSRKTVNICGPATLTVSPSFSQTDTTTAATGTYQISFAGNGIIKVRGQSGNAGYSCNNLPLLTGTVTFAKQ